MLRKSKIRLSSCVIRGSSPEHRRTQAETHTHRLSLNLSQKKGVHTGIFAAASHSHICPDYTSALDLTTGTFTSHEIVLIWVFIIPPYTHTHTSTPSPSFSKQLEEEGVAQKAIDYSWRDGEFELPLPIRQGAGLHSLG